MAKKEKEKEKAPPTLLESMLLGAKKEYGNRTFSGPDGKKLLIGLPLPSLSMMYLFDSNVISLGKVIGLAGEPMSQKSSLGFEFQRLVTMFLNPVNGQHGIAQHIEAEAGKYSPSLHESIITSELFKHVLYTQARSVDDAQDISTKMLALIQDSCKNEKGKMDPQKCNVPIVFTVDSLTGSETEGNREKLQEDGSLGGNFPRMAKAWTEFFRTFPTFMIGWPVIFTFINHLKTEQAKMAGRPDKKYTPGGGGQRFMSSYMIYMQRIGSEQKQTLYVDGDEVKQPHEIRKLELKMDKTSLGYDGRRITVDFIFYRKDNQQYSYFDWDASTVHMLVWMLGDKSKGVVKKELSDVIDFSCSENRYTCKQLKLKGVSATEFGQAIHADSALMMDLFDFLQIQRYGVFNGTMPSLEDDYAEPPREIILAPRNTAAHLPIVSETPAMSDDTPPASKGLALGPPIDWSKVKPPDE